jgi:Ca2+-binding RTX toxin-like protein
LTESKFRDMVKVYSVVLLDLSAFKSSEVKILGVQQMIEIVAIILGGVLSAFFVDISISKKDENNDSSDAEEPLVDNNDLPEMDDSKKASYHGTLGSDSFHGSSVSEEIFGNSGNDELHGLDGDDYLAGDDGADALFGGLGNDSIFGGRSDDVIEGGSGRDLLVGGDGLDLLDGGDGDDTIWADVEKVNLSYFGALGTDNGTLADANELSGGVPSDYTSDMIFGGSGNDVIYLTGGEIVAGGSGSDNFYVLPNVSNVVTFTDFEPSTDRILIYYSAGSQSDPEISFSRVDQNQLNLILDGEVVANFTNGAKVDASMIDLLKV